METTQHLPVPEGDAGEPERDSSSGTVVIGQGMMGSNWKRGNLD